MFERKMISLLISLLNSPLYLLLDIMIWMEFLLLPFMRWINLPDNPSDKSITGKETALYPFDRLVS